MQSEFEFIKRIRHQAARRQSAAIDLVCGIGDDTAILRERAGRETLITVDLLVEEIDFKLEYAPPRWLGHKSLAVSLSDVAAMGGAPAFSLLTLGIPKHNPQSDRFWDEFFAGYFELAETHGMTLVGGDISATPDRMTIDSIVIGRCSAGRATLRSGAKAGDAVYLTGSIGASAVGLKLLLSGARVDESEQSLVQKALRRHLRPEARVEFGRRVGEMGLVHSMIDVSDGLAQDLLHICEESRVHAVIDFASAPVAEEVGLVIEDREAAFALAVSGGEDFELLLTADQNDETGLFGIARDCELRLTRIGQIVAPAEDRREPAIMLRRDGRLDPMLTRGYNHFAV